MAQEPTRVYLVPMSTILCYRQILPEKSNEFGGAEALKIYQTANFYVSHHTGEDYYVCYPANPAGEPFTIDITDWSYNSLEEIMARLAQELETIAGKTGLTILVH